MRAGGPRRAEGGGSTRARARVEAAANRFPLEAERFEVAVLGGGPAGALVALLLAVSGHEVVLLEASTGPFDKLCGEFLSPEAVARLAVLDLAERLAPAGPATLTAVEIVTLQGACWRQELARPAWGLSRWSLDEGLRQAAAVAGARLVRGARVCALVPCPTGGVEVLLQKGTRLRAGVAVVAMGSALPPAFRGGGEEDEVEAVAFKRHWIRRRPEPGLQASGPSQSAHPSQAAGTESGAESGTASGTESRAASGIASQAGSAHASPAAPEGVCRLFPTAGGYCGLVQVEAREGEAERVNLCFLERARAGRGGAEARLARLRRTQPALDAALAGLVPAPSGRWLALGRPALRRCAPLGPASYRVGDAAGSIHPLVGEGMAMALEGAEILVDCLVPRLRGRTSAATARQRYSRAWREAFARRRRLARWLQPIAERPPLAGLAVGILQRAPALGRALLAATRGPWPTSPRRP